MLLKLHHAMADGISGMLVASILFDLQPDAPLGPPAKAAWVPEPAPSTVDLVRDAAEDLVLHPLQALGRAAEAPALAWDDVTEIVSGIGHLVGMGGPPHGPFDVKIGPGRRFATAQVPFERLRAIRHALGGTINDVVLTTVAAGLHDQLTARGEPTKARTLRVMVPVSMRSKGDIGDVGNRVAPAFVDIPIGRMTPRARLRRVRASTKELKDSGLAMSADSIIRLGTYAPPALHAMAARLVSRGQWFNLVVSNVPAAQAPLYLAGARLLMSYPAMPLGENCALSIACTSLAGTMAFGLTADWDAVKDIDVLARGIERATDELAALAGSH